MEAGWMRGLDKWMGVGATQRALECRLGLCSRLHSPLAPRPPSSPPPPSTTQVHTHLSLRLPQGEVGNGGGPHTTVGPNHRQRVRCNQLVQTQPGCPSSRLSAHHWSPAPYPPGTHHPFIRFSSSHLLKQLHSSRPSLAHPSTMHPNPIHLPMSTYPSTATINPSACHAPTALSE